MHATISITLTIAALSLAMATPTHAADQPAAKKPAFDTSYIPKDAVASIVIRPTQALNSPIVKSLLLQAEKSMGKKSITRLFNEMAKDWGTSPRNIREVNLLFSSGLVDRLPQLMFGVNSKDNPDPLDDSDSDDEDNRDERHAVISPGAIVRYTKPVDQKQVLISLMGLSVDGRKPETEKINGKTVYYSGHGTTACFVDAKTLLIGPKITVIKMLAAKKEKSALNRILLKTSNKDDLIFAFSGAAFRTSMARIPRDKIPPNFVKLLNLATKSQHLLLTMRLTGKTLAQIRIGMPDLATAANFSASLNNVLLPVVKSAYKLQLRPLMVKQMVKSARPAINIFDQLEAKIHAITQSSDSVIIFPRPSKLDALSGMFNEFLRQANWANRHNERVKNLKQIGLAFHIYHGKHKRFPGHGSDHNGKSNGLSWRVHLLPYLGQADLYKQFKLNEPWNSPHNKKLISKMPDVFKRQEIKAVGKTSVHVFTGEGTPFGGKKSPRIADITDGTSNTIMAIDAGPIRAEIWTKPGGIPFDPEEESLDDLGMTRLGFYVLFMDGAARFISKKIKIETFHLLIQHADGEVIPDF